MIRRLQIRVFELIVIICVNVLLSSATGYYAIAPFEGIPHYGSVYSYNLQSSAFRFYGNFSFEIDDNTTDFSDDSCSIGNCDIYAKTERQHQITIVLMHWLFVKDA
ncbi:unnamed protein product [Rotaria sordida]|uniref:Uncharacterized protein n=1 Tax=Rotaria sordida TaxID=392033 RepID=A0A814YXZ9_9BILA|nr:unnamed protein product [Rotaria sordida]CAF1236460.1 unnamed protein product [Rotaria sordida]